MVTIDNTKAPATLPATLPTTLQVTLRVQPLPSGRFEVRHGDRLLGTSQNEMMALWSAVGAAEQMARSGQTVRVVLYQQGGDTPSISYSALFRRNVAKLFKRASA